MDKTAGGNNRKNSKGAKSKIDEKELKGSQKSARKERPKFNFLPGRKIIDLGTLSNMSCPYCHEEGSFVYATSETYYCLATTFEIKCPGCEKKYNADACKSYVSEEGIKYFNVNDDAVLEAFDKGISPILVQHILGILEIPVGNPCFCQLYEQELPRLLKKREDEKNMKKTKVSEEEPFELFKGFERIASSSTSSSASTSQTPTA